MNIGDGSLFQKNNILENSFADNINNLTPVDSFTIENLIFIKTACL